jgi:hypothetical protein
MRDLLPRRRLLLAVGLLVACTTSLSARLEPTLALLTHRAELTGNTFATAATFCPPPRTATFLTGFEYGPITALGPFDGAQITGGTPSIETVSRSGTYAAKIPKVATGASSITKYASGTTLVTRLAIRLDTLPVGNVAQLATMGVTGGTGARLGYDASTMKLELGFGPTAAQASSTIEAGTWYVIDLKVDVGANPRTASWRINGANQPVATAAEAAASISGVTTGSTVTADVFTARYDDIVVSATAADYPIGDGRVLGLVPNASPLSGHSGSTRFTDEVGGLVDANAYARLDDVPLTATNDYFKQVTGSATSYLQLELTNASGSCFSGVQALIAFHSASGGGNANNGAVRIFDGATETVVHDGSMFSTSLAYRSAIVTPASEWTAASIDGLVARVGYSTDVNPAPYWDGIQLEYDASP